MLSDEKLNEINQPLNKSRLKRARACVCMYVMDVLMKTKGTKTQHGEVAKASIIKTWARSLTATCSLRRRTT